MPETLCGFAAVAATGIKCAKKKQPNYMHSSITKLHSLLQRMQGKDLAKMTPEAISDLRSTVTKEFVDATAGLNEVLLGQFNKSPRWLWKAEEAESFGGERIATFTIVDTGQMEAAIGQPERVQMAAALFQRMKLEVDLFAAYHHPGGSGLQVEPRIAIKVRVNSDPMFDLVEMSLQKSKSLYPEHGNGISIEIRPTEDCCDGFENPDDAEVAFSQVAEAARNESIRSYGDTDLTEDILISLEMDASVDPERMQDAFTYMGLLFAIPIVSLKEDV